MTLTSSNLICFGLGVFFCYGAIRVRHRVVGSRRTWRASGSAASLGTGQLSELRLSELRPGDIIAAIKEVPVMQQSRADKAYEGMPVCWPVSFESAFSSGLFTLRLMCQDEGNFPWVICDVRRGKYPQLQSLLPHAPLVMQGRISQIKFDEIHLTQVSLTFPQ